MTAITLRRRDRSAKRRRGPPIARCDRTVGRLLDAVEREWASDEEDGGETSVTDHAPDT